MIEDVQNYVDDILNNRIISGINTKNAVKRFVNDLKRDDIVFKEDRVERVIKFIHTLKHYTGKHNGQPFKLEPWQVFIVANLYGFYYIDGRRRFQTAYIEVARKNGKTALMAALSLYGLVADGEAAAEILFAANSKDQAKRGFDCVRAFSRGFDPEEKYLKRYRSDILFPATNSFIKVLAADADKLDGYNCSIGVVDEYHSAPNSNVRDVIRSSQGMRTNPLLITITTAGFDKTLPCYELRTVASEISAGVKEDDSFFSLIYSLDENDNWQDPNNWVKANPNIDVTITKEFIATQVKQAINSPNDEVGVKTKNLNIWCDASTIWIPDEYIIKSTKKFDRSAFKGEECYVGVDLSSNIDLTAVSYLWVKDDKFYFSQDFYLPKDSIKNRPDKQMYAEWHRRGFLKTTSGNVTDYDYITRDILAVNEISPINRIFYDKYNATSWAIQCTDQGLNLEPFSQTIGNFNNTTRTFERLMLGEQVIIDDNPIMRFCLRNVELRMDFNGNVKPLKNVEKKKIDGVIAALQALAAYIDASANIRGTNIY